MPTLMNTDDRIEALDLSLFRRLPSQTSDADKRSLLRIQVAVRRAYTDYVYLEIGSHLGGTIQPHLVDPRCRQIFSIDKRPAAQPDERGHVFDYPENSTARMMAGLRDVAADCDARIVCFDQDASEVDPNQVTPPPHFCFIDGEHTNQAVVSDFQFCFAVAAQDAVIAFHDSWIVFRGLTTITQELDARGAPYEAMQLEGAVYVILLGDAARSLGPALRPYSKDNNTFLRESRRKLALSRFLSSKIGKAVYGVYRRLR